MPQIVPVSDFRADISSVGRFTDEGEIVVLTQHGKPRWAVIDYDEWNAASRAQERAIAAALSKTEEKEASGGLRWLDEDEFGNAIASLKDSLV